jgi:glutaredoxin 3
MFKMKKIFFILLLFLGIFQYNLNAQTVVKQKKQLEKTKKVILIYGSSDCHYCIDAKNLLVKNKIDFIFYDIYTNKVALNEMLAKLKAAKISTTGLGIPVIDKYGEIFSNSANFDDFLKKLIQ